MKVIDKVYKGEHPLYPLERLCDVSHALFIDIETTGLKKETTSLYLIGCGYYTEEGFKVRLFFGERCSEEEMLLREFVSFSRGFDHLIHFNGTGFDIPYLSYKAERYDISGMFDGMQQLDVYRLCKPLRYLLFSQTMRQKAIEDFLGIDRKDMYDGGQLIEVYKQFEQTGSDELFDMLITHNLEDVLGMHRMLPVLYYLDLKDADISYIGYEIRPYLDLEGNRCEEVIFSYNTRVSFPKSFVSKTDTMYLKASADTGNILIRLPLYRTQMKLFFDNYKDYCYLPDEDTVIPRELASSLLPGRYRKATKETCCKKADGRFMKQPDAVFSPVFKTSLKDKKKYFRFPEDFDEKAADIFGRELINVFFKMKKRN
ncbi:MAG: ribonuclease H-like domain-containing protein [Lachnospiraceae bacterium]|nr:ribonuclease H-like domain-containing protein [Lachnospiraceae bacterium]